MNANGSSLFSRVMDRVFPRMPDFYGLMNEQCDLAVEALQVFVSYMEDGDPEKAAVVRALEKRGDQLKERNVDTLNRAFATPMDREDIYRAIVTIDHVVNYAKTTTRELELLSIQPDAFMHAMARELGEGALALRDGYRLLATAPVTAEDHADRVRKAERRIEKIYRRALGRLFDADALVQKLQSDADGAEAEAMLAVVEMFKRREVYRHLSNAGDRMARAGDALHDIVVKIA